MTFLETLKNSIQTFKEQRQEQSLYFDFYDDIQELILQITECLALQKELNDIQNGFDQIYAFLTEQQTNVSVQNNRINAQQEYEQRFGSLNGILEKWRLIYDICEDFEMNSSKNLISKFYQQVYNTINQSNKREIMQDSIYTQQQQKIIEVLMLSKVTNRVNSMNDRQLLQQLRDIFLNEMIRKGYDFEVKNEDNVISKLILFLEKACKQSLSIQNYYETYQTSCEIYQTYCEIYQNKIIPGFKYLKNIFSKQDETIKKLNEKELNLDFKTETQIKQNTSILKYICLGLSKIISYFNFAFYLYLKMIDLLNPDYPVFLKKSVEFILKKIKQLDEYLGVFDKVRNLITQMNSLLGYILINIRVHGQTIIGVEDKFTLFQIIINEPNFQNFEQNVFKFNKGVQIIQNQVNEENKNQDCFNINTKITNVNKQHNENNQNADFIKLDASTNYVRNQQNQQNVEASILSASAQYNNVQNQNNYLNANLKAVSVDYSKNQISDQTNIGNLNATGAQFGASDTQENNTSDLFNANFTAYNASIGKKESFKGIQAFNFSATLSSTGVQVNNSIKPQIFNISFGNSVNLGYNPLALLNLNLGGGGNGGGSSSESKEKEGQSQGNGQLSSDCENSQVANNVNQQSGQFDSALGGQLGQIQEGQLSQAHGGQNVQAQGGQNSQTQSGQNGQKHGSYFQGFKEFNIQKGFDGSQFINLRKNRNQSIDLNQPSNDQKSQSNDISPLFEQQRNQFNQNSQFDRNSINGGQNPKGKSYFQQKTHQNNLYQDFDQFQNQLNIDSFSKDLDNYYEGLVKIDEKKISENKILEKQIQNQTQDIKENNKNQSQDNNHNQEENIKCTCNKKIIEKNDKIASYKDGCTCQQKNGKKIKNLQDNIYSFS